MRALAIVCARASSWHKCRRAHDAHDQRLARSLADTCAQVMLRVLCEGFVTQTAQHTLTPRTEAQCVRQGFEWGGYDPRKAQAGYTFVVHKDKIEEASLVVTVTQVCARQGAWPCCSCLVLVGTWQKEVTRYERTRRASTRLRRLFLSGLSNTLAPASSPKPTPVGGLSAMVLSGTEHCRQAADTHARGCTTGA